VPVSAADWELNASNRSLMTPSSGAASPRPAVYPMPLGQMQTRLPPGGLQRARGRQQPPPQTLSAFPRSDSTHVSAGAADTVLRSMDSIRRAEGAADNMPNGAALRRTPSQESSRQRPYAIVPSVTISNSASLQAPMKPSSTRLQAREGVGCLDDPSTKAQLLQMMEGSTYGPTKSASTDRLQVLEESRLRSYGSSPLLKAKEKSPKSPHSNLSSPGERRSPMSEPQVRAQDVYERLQQSQNQLLKLRDAQKQALARCAAQCNSLMIAAESAERPNDSY